MRATTLVPVKIENPAWNETDFHAARKTGQAYPVPAQIEVDPGFELSGKLVWMHCCPGHHNSAPIAEPADDECRNAVRDWMEKRRPAAIEQIRNALKNVHLLKNPDDQKRIRTLARSYGLTGESAPAEQSAPKIAKKPAAE